MGPISDMLLVVHVPKTAGTSFREALDNYFGPDKVVRDYGHNVEATTEVVRNHLYANGEPKPIGDLLQVISDDSKKVLIGHFPARKYADYFEPQNIIGFMRDPLIRACSEYMHHMRNDSYEGSFCEFMDEDGIRNIQTRFLEGMPEESIIGLTEQYRESLMYINKTFQLKLSPLKRNIDRKGGGQKFAKSLSQHELELFNKLNEKDLELYRCATERFARLDIPETTGKRFFKWLNGR